MRSARVPVQALRADANAYSNVLISSKSPILRCRWPGISFCLASTTPGVREQTANVKVSIAQVGAQRCHSVTQLGKMNVPREPRLPFQCHISAELLQFCLHNQSLSSPFARHIVPIHDFEISGQDFSIMSRKPSLSTIHCHAQASSDFRYKCKSRHSHPKSFPY